MVQLPGSREARSGPTHGGERRGRSPRAASPRISASPVTHSQHTGLTRDATVYHWTQWPLTATPPVCRVHGARDRPAARAFRSGSPGGKRLPGRAGGLDLALLGLPVESGARCPFRGWAGLRPFSCPHLVLLLSRLRSGPVQRVAGRWRGLRDLPAGASPQVCVLTLGT